MQLATCNIPADVTGWWMSEKYDGVRAIWTGKQFLTRNGRPIAVPAHMLKGMPSCRLDGELWAGRGKFNHLVSVIQKKNANWARIRYMVFDAPAPVAFELRQDALQSLQGLPDWVSVVKHRRCRSHGHLSTFEAAVVWLGGEGAVLVAPNSQYRPGRSDIMVKVKRFVPDLDRSCCD